MAAATILAQGAAPPLRITYGSACRSGTRYWHSDRPARRGDRAGRSFWKPDRAHLSVECILRLVEVAFMHPPPSTDVRRRSSATRQDMWRPCDREAKGNAGMAACERSGTAFSRL